MVSEKVINNDVILIVYIYVAYRSIKIYILDIAAILAATVLNATQAKIWNVKSAFR